MADGSSPVVIACFACIADEEDELSFDVRIELLSESTQLLG